MSQNDVFRRYLDAGLAFVEVTRSRAEDIVRELVQAGELQRDQTQQWVEELLERSRHNTEQLISVVRSEIRDQLAGMSVATMPDLSRVEAVVEQRLNELAGRLSDLADSSLRAAASRATGRAGAGAPKASGTRQPAGTTTGAAGSARVSSPAQAPTRTPAKKAPARVKKASTTKTAAPARKAPAKKAAVTGTPAKKTVAKKTVAKKAAVTRKSATGTRPTKSAAKKTNGRS
jgi:polyhydroxyalkanoate synthesis regulator phasin